MGALPVFVSVDATAADTINLTLPWIPEGEVAFMYAARKQGFWAKRGLEVSITRGFGSGSKPSWLLIKHRDEWAGPVNITEFAPLSVKTPDADFADILAADNPDVWHSNAPARTGDTGKLFARIIAQAVAMKTGRGVSQEPAAAAPAKRASRARKGGAPSAATRKTAKKTVKKASTKKPG